MTFLLLLALSYLIVSPDRASLALTRGAAGGARAVTARRGSRSSSGRRASGSSRPASAGRTGGRAGGSARPGVLRSFATGWRSGAAQARERRESGRDVWSRSVRGARAT
ncbi:MAG: hypothetical protein ACRCZP_19325, partial [Phycicoccus sp.]